MKTSNSHIKLWSGSSYNQVVLQLYNTLIIKLKRLCSQIVVCCLWHLICLRLEQDKTYFASAGQGQFIGLFITFQADYHHYPPHLDKRLRCWAATRKFCRFFCCFKFGSIGLNLTELLDSTWSTGQRTLLRTIGP